MLKYGKNKKFNPAVLHRLNIDRQTIGQIPDGSAVLDIGCATGFMGDYLKRKKDCRVVGVEIGREEAREALKVLDRVLVGDVEDGRTLNKITEKFDVIIASAIIEHLKDPWRFLREIKKYLKKDGFIIVTTSNITHWATRMNMVRGKFEYQDYGVLDNTHLCFFTTHTFSQLLKDSGYKVDKFLIDPVGGGYPKVSFLMSKLFPNLFAYQMLIRAVPKK